MTDVHICKIESKIKLIDDVYLITVDNENLAENARPGRFLHIKCGSERLLRRPISIFNTENSKTSFVFDIRGDGTRWLSERIPGESLDILGSLGNGFDICGLNKLNRDAKVIVVGGGLGIPPLFYAANDIVSRGGRVTSILGFRDKKKVMLEHFFAKICDEVTITTEDGSLGILGLATKPLERLLINGGFDTVLSCGPLPMLKSVAALCAEHNTPCLVSLEERMACGVGACLVCACATKIDGIQDMSRVCADGPVFHASDIIW